MFRWQVKPNPHRTIYDAIVFNAIDFLNSFNS